MSPSGNGPEQLDLLLALQDLAVAPSRFDTFPAGAVRMSGSSAAYVTGTGSWLSHLGAPDLALISESDTVDQIFRSAEAPTLPPIVDGDTGFGGIVNVVRTHLVAPEIAAAAAIHGHFVGLRDLQ